MNRRLRTKISELNKEIETHAKKLAKDKISSAIRGAICVDPVPRNIHPVHNEARRKARAEAILGKIDSSSTALFVDAAKYWKKDAYVVTVVNAKGSIVNAATVVTGFTHEAEELAIAVALQERRRDVTRLANCHQVIFIRFSLHRSRKHC
ncbi:hypothetical protein HPB52_020055 [Rhipicephalus sanguineus]|uniref:Tick transposon n=1 Tax=Rhipicephalus sanguineus TaxID=34632 RepID=A0A9D4PG18_RHISA|nr:hypothetical protein HPB52_020055 [Rhipicephalus sanguineus]